VVILLSAGLRPDILKLEGIIPMVFKVSIALNMAESVTILFNES